jgi:hypothetical protein
MSLVMKNVPKVYNGKNCHISIIPVSSSKVKVQMLCVIDCVSYHPMLAKVIGIAFKDQKKSLHGDPIRLCN